MDKFDSATKEFFKGFNPNWEKVSCEINQDLEAAQDYYTEYGETDNPFIHSILSSSNAGVYMFKGLYESLSGVELSEELLDDDCIYDYEYELLEEIEELVKKETGIDNIGVQFCEAGICVVIYPE